LTTQSAWRNAQNAANGGVGLLVNKAAKNVLSNVKYINKRIMITTFNGNPTTTIIVNYAPQEDTQDVIDYYDNLINTIKQVPNIISFWSLATLTDTLVKMMADLPITKILTTTANYSSTCHWNVKC